MPHETIAGRATARPWLAPTLTFMIGLATLLAHGTPGFAAAPTGPHQAMAAGAIVAEGAPAPRGATSRVAMMRPPVIARRCLADQAGASCRFRLTPPAVHEPVAQASASIRIGHQPTAVIGLLGVALGLALALVAVFWRHLAVAAGEDTRPRRVKRKA